MLLPLPPTTVTLVPFVVERLSWEMAQWEIHALRGLATVVVIQVQMYAKAHPEARPLAHTPPRLSISMLISAAVGLFVGLLWQGR